MKLLNSLQTKLTLSFISLIVVVSFMTFLYTFGETKKAIKEILRSELQALSSMVAADLSGADADLLASFKSGDETSKEFIRIRNKLKALKDSYPDIKYIYTMKNEEHKIKFMVDADYGNQKDPGAAIDEDYETKSDVIFQGFEKPIAENEFYTDKWGTLLSGYAPLKDSKGNIVGLLGVDMSSDLVLKKEKFIGNTIYVVIGVGILIAGLFILIFSKTIIKDINKLNKIANDISMGNMNVDMEVERKDEIGDLAKSFGRMVASLKITMMMNTPTKDNGSNK